MSVKWGGRGCGHISRWSETVANWNGSVSLYLDFINTQTLDPRITFTRSTTATFTGSNGLIQTAAINAPRFDYDPVTLAPKGLLIEESRTNLFLQSEDFTAASWTKTRSSITADNAVSPDGTQDADKLVEDTTAASTHDLAISSLSLTSGVSYTVSFYAKRSGRNIRLYFPSAVFGTAFSSVFDLENGTSSAAVTGSVSSITSVGNGWYRCTMTQTATASATSGFTWRLIEGASTIAYTGDGTSGIFIWGAQLEAGAFATSYIPTTTAAATRAADVAVMQGANFSNWYNAVEGTLFAEFAPEGLKSVASQVFVQADDGTTNNRLLMGAGSTNAMQMLTASGGTQDGTVTTPATTYAAGTFYKQAFAVKVNDLQAAVNGTSGNVDTTATMPVSLSSMRLGASTLATSNMWFRRIAYFPRRLSDAELQGITS